MFHFIEAAVSDGEEKDQDTMEDKDKSDKKDPSHKAKGASPDRVNPYVLTAPASLDS